MTVPFLGHEQLADPVRLAGKYRIPLLNQVAVLGQSAPVARKRTVQAARHFLKNGQENLLGVARDDLAALASWRHLVRSGQMEFEIRYRREYLTTERFRRFDEALVKLLELLELPGVGKYVSGALTVLRTPYRLLKGWLARTVQRPDSPGLPEKKVLEAGFTGWMDYLRKEATRHTDTNPLWQHIHKGFQTTLTKAAHEQFEQGVHGFQQGLVDEVDRTARAIYEDLAKNPVALNTLRGTKFAMEIAAIGTAIAAGGISVMDFFWVPLAASVTHHLVELLGKQYVDTQRELARIRQQALVSQHLSGSLAEWLIQWPTTGGSAYERLQMVLRRVPQAIGELDAALEKAV